MELDSVAIVSLLFEKGVGINLVLYKDYYSLGLYSPSWTSERDYIKRLSSAR